MKKMLKQLACIMLSLTMIAAFVPPGFVWAEDGAPEEVTAEGAENASSVIVEEEASDETAGNEDTGSEESEINNEEETIDTVEEDVPEEIPEEIKKGPDTKTVEPAEENTVTVVSDIENGTVTMDGTHGTAVPNAGYDLATVRQIWTDTEGVSHEQYLDYTEDNGVYSFDAEPEAGDSEITAFFFSLTRWDGAVDLTWYDPDQTEFEIGTPAQLAGLAAIANGMVDEKVTAEYMIKDNEGRSLSDGVYTHEHISTEPWLVDLLSPNASSGTSPEASQVRDTAWRLPEVEHNKIASDDLHNDFLYRTVRLTADLDMSGANWTPIGGKYAMNRDAETGIEAKVIDTRFQGVFDGQGHAVTLDCNRQAKMGFPYAMEIAFIGYLGGGVDYDNGYPKDTCMDYAKYWVPAVRNVVIRGEVKGRRMVGGVVGRIGETNYGVIVENCVNNANIEATDMRGCAGIVGAAWGKSVIRNCYNTGTIHSGFWEHGGIVGSNGYEGTGTRVPCGASVYNCYNVGDSGLSIGNDQYKYNGHEIGVDGNANASYEIANCYYIEPQEAIEGKTGYCTGENNINKNAKLRNVEALDPSFMKTAAFVDLLNMNGKVFVSDGSNINDGYPVLYYQAAQHTGNASVTLDDEGSANGSIAFETGDSSTLTDVPYGSIVDLKAKAAPGYRLTKYVVTADNGSEEFEMSTGNFVAVTGTDITVRAVFDEVSKTRILFNEPDDEGKLYYVEVKKVGYYNGEENVKIDPPVEVRSGDELDYLDRITVTGVMKPWGDREPDDNNTEYTGNLSDPYEDPSLKKVANTNNVYEITGANDTANIQFKPKTQGKRWSTIADTSWYTGTENEYVITTARQLAGVSRLCLDRTTDFAGVTIRLGNDISLANTKDNGGNGYEMSWFGIGIARNPFRGTFDGQGYTIRHMHRNFAPGMCELSAGARGGLFGVTEGAVIKNVNVESGTYSDNGNEYICGFINGASGGGIAGIATDTLIENCSADIPMSGGISGIVGGIAGEIEGTTVIKNCTSNCSINSIGESVGGIAAILAGSDARIENCVNNGEITTTKWKTGGILGSGESFSAAISRCVNNGSISASMRGTSSDVHSIGGIVGFAAGAVTISECINKGALFGYQKTYGIGGVAGSLKKGTITDSINLGDIYSESTSDWAEVSGISNVDTNKSNKSTIRNCYNAGSVTVSSEYKGKAGGVVAEGNTTKNVFENIYCTSTSVSSIGGKAGIAGKTVKDADLKALKVTLGDAFAIDRNDINGGFPVLAWQDPSAVAILRSISIKKSGSDSLAVSWTAAGPRDGFELQRSVNGGAWSEVFNGNALSYTGKGLAIGSKYSFRVRAFSVSDGNVNYSDWSKAVSAELLPPAMKISSAKNSKKGTAVIKWKRMKGAAGYVLYRSTSKSGKYKKLKTVKVTKKNKNKKTLSFTNKKLKKKKTYYYKIVYYKKISGKTVYSEMSAPKSVKIKK